MVASPSPSGEHRDRGPGPQCPLMSGAEEYLPELFFFNPVMINTRQETGDGNGKDQELAGDCV